MSRPRLTRASLVLAVAATFLLARPGALAGSGSEQPVEEFTSRIDRCIAKLMDDHGIPGVGVALVREGELVWSAAYGYADLESGRPMTVDTVNRAESISKSVTAWGVMRLVEEGRLGLDDPIFDHVDRRTIPETDLSADAITVRRLLSHTAGVSMGTIGREYAPDGPVPSLAEGLSGEFKLVARPGSGFLYSNTGFNLLELIIEEVTGEDFAAYMQREILAPLGMTRTYTSLADAKANGLTETHRYAFGFPFASAPKYQTALLLTGYVYSTAEDMARYLTMYLQGGILDGTRVLSEAGVAQMLTGATNERTFQLQSHKFTARYGAGWFVNLFQGDGNWWHGGSMPGTTAMLVRTHNDVVWIGLFNGRTVTPNNSESELDATLWKAFTSVTSFPSHDLFSSFR